MKNLTPSLLNDEAWYEARGKPRLRSISPISRPTSVGVQHFLRVVSSIAVAGQDQRGDLVADLVMN